MIRLITSLLCQALIGLSLGLLIADLAHASSTPPGWRSKLDRML